MLATSIAVMLGTALVGRLMQRSWLAPGAFFAAFWLFLVLSTIVGANDYPLPPIGVMWLAFASTCVVIGSTLGIAVFDRPVNAISHFDADATFPHLAKVVAACACSGLAYVALHVAILGPVWNLSANASDLPPIFQFLLAAQYAGPAFGGIYSALRLRHYRLTGALSMLAAVLTGLIYVRRSLLLMSGMFWLGGYFATQVFMDRGRPRLITRKRVLIMAALVVILPTVLMLFEMFRFQLTGRERSIGDIIQAYSLAFSADLIPEAWLRVRGLFFSYPSTFSVWLDSVWGNMPDPTYGAWTFAGLFQTLGIVDRVRIADFEVQIGEYTNLYTAFYGLILDFNPLGALVVLGIGGFLSGAAFRLASRGMTLALPLLIGFYAGTIFSPIWSLFRYNVLGVALVYLAIYSSLAALVSQRRMKMAVKSASQPLPVASERVRTAAGYRR